MKKIKHFLLTLAFLISFTSYSFSQEYESNKLFLKIKNNVEINLEKKNDEAWTSFLKKHNILKISKVFRIVEMNQYYLIETKDNVDLAKLILEFKQFEFIEFSERVPIYKLFFTPNDPQYSNQWNLAKIQADLAWNINLGSNSIKIAVIDDGFLLNHEDLSSKWHINPNEIPNNNIDDDNNGYIDDWRGWDAADNDKDPSAFNPTNSYFTHGTHVAGIVAASTNNSLGIASIGYNCKLIPVKIGNDATSSLSGAYLGVEYAIVSGAQVMNMSWGGSGFSATYQALFNLAKSKGMVCVAAAGNSSTSMPMYPAAYNNVISVASSTSTDALSSFTNYGSTIDVTAPGSDILSTLAGGISNYGIFSGTSMASPLVAGLCGLMMSNNAGMHPDSVEACLKRSCDNIDVQNPTKTGQFGAGRINAFKALQCTQKAPLADFEVLDTFQCVNTIVRYKSNSSGIQPLTYSWSFPGGTPSSSTFANPQVTYSSPGLYSATLTVSNNFGTNTITKTNIVRIGTPTAKLSGRKYTTYGTNAAILAISFIGTPPYNITLTDGSNVWTQNNIISNPYFYSIIPTKDTSIIQIQSFSDKNCVGIGSMMDTIVKLKSANTDTSKKSYDCLRVKSHQLITENTGGFNYILPSTGFFGMGCENIGDWNNDGINDLMVGAPLINNNNGKLFLLNLNINGTVKAQSTIDNTNSPFNGINNHIDAQLGASICLVGDIDQDGIKDIIATGPNNTSVQKGSAFVLFMNGNGTVKAIVKWEDGINGIPSGTLESIGRFGWKVSSIGDWDNDGTPDVVIGAGNSNEGGSNKGAIYICLINTNGSVKQIIKNSSLNNSILNSTINNEDRFGSPVYLGDINKDGLKDFAVGACYRNYNSVQTGGVFIVSMNSAGSIVQILSNIGPNSGGFNETLNSNDLFGYNVSGIGDYDKDGINDIIVGAVNDDDGGIDKGAAWILFLNSNGTVKRSFKISQTKGNFKGGLSNNANFGFGLTNIGDLDNNGYEDFAVGSYNQTVNGISKGAVWVLFMEDTCSVDVATCEHSFNFNGNSNNVVKIDPQNGAAWKDLYSVNGFTWECWFNLGNRTSNSFSNTESLMSASDANLCEDIGLHFNWPGWPGVGKLNWVASGQTGCSAPTGVASTNMTFNANTWYYVAGVMNYSTNTMQLYVNGNLVGTKSLTIPLSVRMQNNVAVTIGNQDVNYNPYSSFSPFKGKIDEVRFWNIPRNASDIQASYKNCLPASTPNLVAYFKGDEGSGTNTASLINNNFIGTLQNGATWSTQVDSVKNCTLCNNNNNQTCDTSGLVLCMAMDGNANDSTKYNNHGIIRGATPTIGRDGKTNSAYYFNGITNHINLGVKNILKPSAASISVWVKPQTFNSYIGTNSNTIIITKNPNNPSSFMEGYSLSLTNRTGTTKYMAINTHQPTNNEKWFMSTQNTNLNQWTHLVLTFDFDSIKLYVNGQLDNKIYKGFNNVYDAFDSVVIGYSANIMNKNYFKGDIDELKMYNRVLSSSEILNLYTKPFSCSCASKSSSNQTDCDTTNLNVGKVLHLDFNGNTQDKSGNNNHATNFGATLVAGKDGVVNTAYRFDGINDYMKVNHHSSLNNSNITLTALIKPNGFYNGTCYGNQIMKKGQTDFVNGEYGMIYSPGAFTNSCYQFDTFHQNYAGFTHNNRPSANLNNIAPYVKSGQWDCLVYTKDNDSSKFYINGILKYATLSVNHGTNFDDLFIGKMDNSQYPYWLNADIDDIRIYNRSLSASEVKGYCGTCNVSPPISVKCDTGKKYVYTKCINDTIQLNIGKGKNHQWSPTTDLSNDNIQNPKCFAKSSIPYFVLYNDTNNCQIIDTLQINVFPSNHIPLFDSTVCIGDSIFYSLDNNGTNYNWNPNQYLSSNNQSSVWLKPLTNTSYNISYKDQNGCKILDTFDIKTKICCELKAIFEINDSIICKEGLVSIFNNSKNIATATYNWTFTNISPSQYIGYTPPSIPLNQQGVYSIKLKTFNGICEDSMTRNIYVIDIKANAGKDSTFCTGTIANLKIGDSNAIADYKYSWAPITGLDNANMASPTVNISQNIQYELSVYDPYTGCVAHDTIFLGINNNLDTFKYIDTLCDGDTKVFFGQNITISGIYQHYVKDKLNCDKEVHILNIFFRKPNFSNSIQKACNFYTDKNGIKHTDSFEYKDSTYINGCLANIHTTKIKILKTRYEEIDMTGCYKMNWKGKTYIDTIKKIDSFTFKDNGCDTLIQYVNLNVVKKSDIKIITTHANPLNYGEEIILQAFGSNNYKWNTGDIGFQLSHTATKDYQFYVVGYNNVLCPDTAYYNIILNTQSVIELPDIFSPNDDGKNDLFKPNYKGNVQLLDLIIFNRWGEKMFEGHGNEAYWNGKYKGEYQSPGAYIYLFRYILNGKEVSKKGSFVLVR